MKKKAISIILVILFAVMAVISGCGNKGIVFYVTKNGSSTSIITGVKSNKTDFNLYDVTLDFYYGIEREMNNECSVIVGTDENGYDQQERCPIIGVGIYLCNARYYDDIIREPHYMYWRTEDYTKIYGLHFVKFIGIDEFNSDKYSVNINRFFIFSDLSTKSFNHKETLTVPASILDPNMTSGWEKTSFCFLVMPICYVESENKYGRSWERGILKIDYEFLDEGTVRLSRGYGY